MRFHNGFWRHHAETITTPAPTVTPLSPPYVPDPEVLSPAKTCPSQIEKIVKDI